MCSLEGCQMFMAVVIRYQEIYSFEKHSCAAVSTVAAEHKGLPFDSGFDLLFRL